MSLWPQAVVHKQLDEDLTIQIVKLLLSHGADVHIRTTQKSKTALAVAYQRRKIDVCRELIKLGAEKDLGPTDFKDHFRELLKPAGTLTLFPEAVNSAGDTIHKLQIALRFLLELDADNTILSDAHLFWVATQNPISGFADLMLDAGEPDLNYTPPNQDRTCLHNVISTKVSISDRHVPRELASRMIRAVWMSTRAAH